MSLNAFIWANELPDDLVSGSSYRVLLKLANEARSDGTGAYIIVDRAAAQLGKSARTVQRALAELRGHGLIKLGNQRLIDGTYPANRRPTVYDLNLDYGKTYTQTVPLPTLEPVDNPALGVTNMSPQESRGDIPGPPGVTTGVVSRTRFNPLRRTNQTSHSTRELEAVENPRPRLSARSITEHGYVLHAGYVSGVVCLAMPDADAPAYCNLGHLLTRPEDRS